MENDGFMVGTSSESVPELANSGGLWKHGFIWTALVYDSLWTNKPIVDCLFTFTYLWDDCSTNQWVLLMEEDKRVHWFLGGRIIPNKGFLTSTTFFDQKRIYLNSIELVSSETRAEYEPAICLGLSKHEVSHFHHDSIHWWTISQRFSWNTLMEVF